jgi:hypothetical protein
MYMTQGLHRSRAATPRRHRGVRFAGRARSFRDLRRTRRAPGRRAAQALGMQAGDRVAMLSLNSDRYLEYQMAVPWGGGVLNPCNIRWSPAEILYSLEDSGSTILLVDETFRAVVEQMRTQSKSLREVIYCGDGPLAGRHAQLRGAASTPPAPVPDAVRRGEDLAGIFYTGGTTGFPKGVMLSHINICSSALAAAGRGPGAARRLLPACRTDVPPGRHGPGHRRTGSRATRTAILPMFTPEGVLERHRARPRDQPAAGAHHDPDAGRPPRHAQTARPEQPEGHHLRRLADLRGRAEPRHGSFPGRRFRAGLRHDRAVAHRHAATRPSSTRPRAARLGKLRSAGRASVCMEVRIVDADGTEVPRGTVGEDGGARPQRDAGLLEQARADRRSAARVAGCTPATAPTWTTDGYHLRGRPA